MLKSICFILLSAIAVSACTSGSKHLSQETATVQDTSLTTGISLKVLNYNIHHANPPSKPDTIDLDAIAQVIRRAAPDVVALQEVDVNTGRSGPYNQAEELANLMGMHFFFAKAIDYDGGAYGIAILSRYPMQNTRQYALPSNPDTGGEPRILATADIQLPKKQVVTFACTHLDAQRDPENRLMQIRKIDEILLEVQHPVILAGDFNATAGTEVIQVLDQNFTRTCDTCDPTIPADHPVKAIDFIAYKPENRFSVQKHQVMQEPYASDHAPVFSLLQLKSKE